MPSALGTRLRQARRFAGLTAAAAAAEIKRGKLTIYRLEWGTTVPSIERLRELSGVYGVSLAWLATGEGTPHEQRFSSSA